MISLTMPNALIPDRITEMLVQKMVGEYRNSFIYKSIRAWFERYNLSGLALYFKLQAHDEQKHGEMIEDYLAIKQVPYNIPSFTYEEVQFPIDMIDAIKFIAQAYKSVEWATTQQLYSILDASKELKDRATESWLMAVREGLEFALIPEQDSELLEAFDLHDEIMRVIGDSPQLIGVGLNAISARLEDKLKG